MNFSHVSFELDWRAFIPALALSTLIYFLLKMKTKWPFPQIFVSNISAFDTSKKNWRSYCSKLPDYLLCAAFAAFLLAFIDPRLYVEHKPEEPSTNDKQKPPSENNLSVEGIAIYLVLDQSGSMTEEVRAQTPDGRSTRISKIDLLKQVTTLFINGDKQVGLSGRPNDLIGLVEFARTAQVLVPLTLDHQEVLDQLNNFEQVKDKDQDGTAIGYAIYKTASLIAATRNYARDLIGKGKPAYEIKNSVILLVTDGMQDPNPLDEKNPLRWMNPLQAAEFAKENNVRLYIVNVEPSLAAPKFAANRRQMSKAAELTGGKFFIVDSSSNLASIYAEINNLEKSSVPIRQELLAKLNRNLSKDDLPGAYKRISFYPYLIALGLLCLGLSVLLDATLLRKVP